MNKKRKVYMEAGAICLLLFVRLNSGVAEEVKMGRLSAEIKEDNSFVLKADGVPVIRDDYGLIIDTQWHSAIMSLLEKEGRLSIQENEDIKKITLVYEKPEVGYFKRQIILLPDECLILWEGEFKTKEESVARIGLFIPEETVKGSSFKVVQLDTGYEFGGELGSGEEGTDFKYSVRHVKIHSQPSLTIEAAHFPTLVFKEVKEGVKWASTFFQDSTKDKKGYQIYLDSITNPPGAKIELAMRVKVGEEKSPYEEWIFPHYYLGKGRDDIFDIISDNFTLIFKRDKKYLLSGEEINIGAEAFTLDNKEREIKIDFSLYDYYDKKVKEGEIIFSNEGKSYLEKNLLHFIPQETGMYRMRFSYQEPVTGIKRERQVSFAVFPRQKTVPLSSNIGAHVYMTEEFARMAYNAGVRWIRLGTTCGLYPDATEENGFLPDKQQIEHPWKSHVFPSSDEIYGLVEKYNLYPLTILDVTEKDRGKVDYTSEEFFNLWERYVKSIVTRYKGKIKAYEIMNESIGPLPTGKGAFRNQPLELYVKYLKSTYEIIKSIDPEAIVVGICGPQWVFDPYDELFALGALDYLDVVSIHYINPTSPPDYGSRLLGMMEKVDKLRQIMRKYGKEKPIWNSEELMWLEGHFYESTYPYLKRDVDDDRNNAKTPYYQEAAERIVKLNLAHIAKNVKMFYFNGFSPGLGWQLCETDHTPTPPIVALAVMSNMLSEVKFSQALIGENIQVYLFEGQEKPIACIFGYNLKGKTKKLVLPVSSKNLKAVNIMGNENPLSGEDNVTITLSEEPVYLLGEGVNTEQFLSLFQKAKIEGLDK